MSDCKTLVKSSSSGSLTKPGLHTTLKLAKCKSFHLTQSEKLPPIRLVSSQGKFTRNKPFRFVHRPRKILKVEKETHEQRNITTTDVEQLESFLLCKRKYKIKLSSDIIDAKVKERKPRSLEKVDCVKRIKKEKNKPYILIPFMSKRKMTDLKLYEKESNILEKAEEHEETLHSTKNDEDIDTDDEHIVKAKKKIIAGLLDAIKKHCKHTDFSEINNEVEEPEVKDDVPEAQTKYSFIDDVTSQSVIN